MDHLSSASPAGFPTVGRSVCEDDLYVKMNARGKPLTSFEVFKAELLQHTEKIFGDERHDGDSSRRRSSFRVTSQSSSKLSNPMIRSPRCNNRRAAWNPMKPAV